MADVTVKCDKRGIDGNDLRALSSCVTQRKKFYFGFPSPRGLLIALRQVHADFVAWWYQPHAKVIEAPLALLDAIRVKRHFFGYLLALLTVYLLYTPAAPAVADVLCLGYPIVASLRVIRGQSRNATNRLLTFWLLYSGFSLFEHGGSAWFIYWLAKVAISMIRYLPRTAGEGTTTKVYYELLSFS